MKFPRQNGSRDQFCLFSDAGLANQMSMFGPAFAILPRRMALSHISLAATNRKNDELGFELGRISAGQVDCGRTFARGGRRTPRRQSIDRLSTAGGGGVHGR